jgi:dihydrofolate reductase
MANKSITIVVAMGRNRGIGLDGRMPWHLPAELRHFKAVTMGKPVVMGRKTWEAIGRPLPGRQNIVVSRNEQFQAPGCDVVGSLVEAVEAAEGMEVMLIGGGELYRQALPLASRLLLTEIDLEPAADTWFPQWDPAEWRLVGSQRHEADDENRYAFETTEWVRVGRDPA